MKGKSHDGVRRKIRQALQAESDNVWKDVEEQGLFEQALDVMRGKHRFLTVIANVVIAVFFAMMVYCVVRFFDAQTTRTQIAWSVGFLASNMVVAMLKLWFWMQMDKNTVIREVKRLELQVATLAGIIKKQT